MTFSNISETAPLVLSKRLRALGVTSPKRAAVLPDLPTIAEALPGYEFITWHALVAPRATPPPIVSLLSERVRATLRAADTTQRFADRGLDVVGSTSEELAAHFKREVQKRAGVIKDRGMRAE